MKCQTQHEFSRHACGQRIDIVLDNAGLELFGDLVLADFLINVVKVGKVIFRGKVPFIIVFSALLIQIYVLFQIYQVIL